MRHSEPVILLTGATGQLGRELLPALAQLGTVVPAFHSATEAQAMDGVFLDLTDLCAIKQRIREVRPQLVINAAAYTAVDRAQEEPSRAMVVNGTAVAVLAEATAANQAALVHFSTDYVFSGLREGPWRESDPTEPLNVYGRTKLAGELAIRKIGLPHLIARVSWLYGDPRRDFVGAILRAAACQSELRVVNDQHGAPTSVSVIAGVVAEIVAQARGDFQGFLRSRGGLLHVACRGRASRDEFAREILRLARERGTPLKARKVLSVATEDMPRPAERPANSLFNLERLHTTFGIQTPHWKQALRDHLDIHKDLATTPDPRHAA